MSNDKYINTNDVTPTAFPKWKADLSPFDVNDIYA
jgi:hypothetical protein